MFYIVNNALKEFIYITLHQLKPIHKQTRKTLKKPDIRSLLKLKKEKKWDRLPNPCRVDGGIGSGIGSSPICTEIPCPFEGGVGRPIRFQIPVFILRGISSISATTI